MKEYRRILEEKQAENEAKVCFIRIDKLVVSVSNDHSVF